MQTSINESKQLNYFAEKYQYRSINHPIVEFFAIQRLKFISSIIDLARITKALDVGCGNGVSDFYFKRYINDLYGIDFSNDLLNEHPFKDTGKFIIGNAKNLPYNNNSFELVYCWEVLHHIDKPEKAVSEMIRVSSKYVIIAEPNPINLAQFLFAVFDKEHRGVFKFSKSYLKSLVTDQNIKILTSVSGGLIFPNKTPEFLFNLVKKLKYENFYGITNWLFLEKIG